MTGREGDNAVRGVVFAILPALAAWALMAVLVWLLTFLLPDSVLIALAAGLIVGPLIVWAFRGPGVEDDIR